ncbi:MAG TPA: putative Ig domain-containing protein [Gemmatales bacterium]|nr:putative Ig domain-containing protein [Gemmatales bacterium]
MSFLKAARWIEKWASYVQRTEKQFGPKHRKRSLRLEELEPRILLNSDWYVVPGSQLEQVSVTFKRTPGNTPYSNELDVYIVSDDAGRVEGLLPTDTGYASAVNRNSKIVFSTTSSSTASTTFTYPGGTRLGFSLVQNATSKTWLSKNPTNTLSTKPLLFFSFDGANPDSVDHVKTTTVASEVRYRWEDRTSLADRDYNDMMYSIKAQRPNTFTPGTTGQVTPTTFTLTGTDADLKNELGIYLVDNAQGAVNGIAPGQPGYAQAALTAVSSQVVFARGAKKGATVTVNLPSEKYFGLYLIQNSTTANFLATNPTNAKVKGKPNVFFSFTSANPDKFNHLRWSTTAANSFGFEDLYGGGDKDFNDLVAKFTFGTPTTGTASNTPPRISDIVNQTIPVGATLGPVPFVVDDDETPANQLVVSATSSNLTLLPSGNIHLGGSGNNRTFTLTPLSGKSGTADITITVSDAGGLIASDTFTLTVTNGTTFPNDLAGWTVAERGGTGGKRGAASVTNNQVVMTEGDSFVTSLSRSFIVPENAAPLEFTYNGPTFDGADLGFVNDAFEVALLDGDGNPLTPTFTSSRDSFFNLTDGTTPQQAPGVRVLGKTVTLDLSTVPVGTKATLVFRLINNDDDANSTVTLKSTFLPTQIAAEAPIKFFVADAAAQSAFRYGEEGLGAGKFAAVGSALSGAASNPSGDKVWLVDAATRRVNIYSSAGISQGSWIATDVTNPQGVTVNNGDLWLVDKGTKTVRRYEGGMGQTTDIAANDWFALDPANASPSDLVTDGSTIWVTDDTLVEVFVYDVSGTLLGRWKLDSDNSAPSGITRNPAGGSDLWVVDRARKEVFQYPSGANTRSGQLGAAGTFLLGPGNVSPEGIADPPPNGTIHFNAFTAPIGPTIGFAFAGDKFVGSLVGGEFGSLYSTDLDGSNIRPFAPFVRVPAPGSEHYVASSLGLGGFPDRDIYVAAGNGILHIDHAGTQGDMIVSGLTASVRGILFDSVGTFNYDMLVTTSGGQVYRVTSDGTASLLASLGEDTEGLDVAPMGAHFATFDGQLITASEGSGIIRAISSTGVVSILTFVGGGPEELSFVPLNLGASGSPLEGMYGANYPSNIVKADASEFEGWQGDVIVTSEISHTVNRIHWNGSAFEVSVVGSFSSQPEDGIFVSNDIITGKYQVILTASAPETDVRSGTQLLITGNASSVRSTDGATRDIVRVTINGSPVQSLDAAGNFFAAVEIQPGENRFTIEAEDVGGLKAETHLVLAGRNPSSTFNSSQLVDLTSDFRGEYARTSFQTSSKTLYADIAVRNLGQYPAGVPLYVGVKNISDPAVQVLNAAGTLPDGTPYYDFTGLVTGGATQLAPNASTGTLSLAFSNPNRGRFTYDLVFLGVPNRAPIFTTIPELEATVGHQYRYDTYATDPDNDPLTFTLLSRPTGMTIDPVTCILTWTPTVAQVGNFPVSVQVSDGRGGLARQDFIVTAESSRPNRPPIFASIPLVDAEFGKAYSYDANATDPDGDTLVYSLSVFPSGMTIDQATGVISWTPTASQIGHSTVTVITDDNHGGTASQTFEVCVHAGDNRPPIIVSEPVTHTLPVPGIELTAIIRDFTPSTNPDFEYGGGGPGMVDTVLGADNTPTLADPDNTSSIHSAETFYQWYHDVPGVNLRTDYPLFLTETSPGSGILQFTSNDFFPIDGQLFGDYAYGHNYHFTLELHTQFVYHGGESFNFAGDDDVWVYINKNLVVDLGGIHGTQGAVVNLDSLGLNAGQSYSFDMFFAERHTVGSTLSMQTGIQLETNNPQYYEYQVQSLDPDGGAATYSLTQAPNGMQINPSTGKIIWLRTQGLAGQSFPIIVHVDDGKGGSDEQHFNVNVIGDTGEREFDPVVEWHKGSFTVRPDSNQVMMTPAVIDLNDDGTPDIVFSTYTGSNYNSAGLLRAIDGRDGSELWTVNDSRYLVSGRAGIAVGDIDGDGQPEIIAEHESNRLIAFDADGSFKWISNTNPGGVDWGSASLADLDHDGTPEIIIGATVLNANGTIRWSGNIGQGNNAFGPLSIVADLDMDGSPEIVAGNTAYHADGAVYWTKPIGDGFPAIGNFDSDSFPEVVVVSSGYVYLLNHDGTIKWGPVAIPGGGNGGAPTIADFDNDGQPEIGVAGAGAYTVFETNGSIKWSMLTQDFSSNVTGSSVFDFDGDGQAEVVYGDELFLRIYRGTDGTVLYQLPKGSGTTYEYPVITDVDGDGNAEIVAVANQLIGGAETGIYVIGDRNNTWVNARQIWNQHSYHITNVNDDGTIPAFEKNSWQAYNTYRLNVLTTGFDPRSAPDLLVTDVSQSAASSGDVRFTATVLNDGSPVLPGVSVAFYDGNPSRGGQLLGTVQTTQRLKQGESEDVSFTVPPGSINDLWVKVDDDGTGLGTVPEFDETNNAYRPGIDLDPVNYAPKQTRPFTSTELAATARSPFKLTLPVLDPNGDPITYEVIAGPDGLMVQPSTGVVAWYPKRDQVGENQAVIKATDSFGHMTIVPFTVTVTAPNTAPVFTTLPPAGPAVVNRPFEYRALAQDAEQADLAFSLVNPLPGMSISSDGVFTWTPTTASSSDITIRVSDGTMVTDQLFTLNVQAAATNRDPQLSVEAASSAWLGRNYIARLIGSDVDGDPVRYELLDGPSGTALDPVSGVLTWKPAAIGSVTFQVRATDGRGGKSDASFNVNITGDDANTAPVIISNPDQAGHVGEHYAYDPVIRDAEGGPMFWTLVSGPQGMSIDSQRGLLRWIPADDQTGPVTVTIRAADSALASGEQTFTINVSCSNAPPMITSRPPTIAYANNPYLYAVRAVDPENDPLTFELTSAPTGMAFVPGTSIIRWTPTTADAGPHEVAIRVTDQAGNTATQTFTLIVSTETPNRPPVITSRPPLGTTVGRAYVYTVSAHDPDGDALSYALTDTPTGMTIDAVSGRIDWTPGAPAQATVTVEVKDTHGGLAVQSYVITARANQAPTLEPIANATAALGGVFRVTARASDPEGDPLTYSLLQAPTGMTIDAQGRIAWTPIGQPRTESVLVQVQDTGGLTATTVFTLTLVTDDEAPHVTLSLSRTTAGIGTPVQIHVLATDNIGISQLTLSVTQSGVTSDVPLSAAGYAVFTPTTLGRYTFTTTATDTSSNTATATADLSAYDPSAQSDVSTSFTRLEMLTAPGQYQEFLVTNDDSGTPPDLSYLTDVYGTVKSNGQPLAYWQLLMAPAEQVDIYNVDPNSPVWTELKRGTSTPTDGLLGTFDPTLLQNDGYVLALVAYDASGSGWVQPVRVNVIGNAKLGDFHLEFTDLSLPLNGIPITITRVYDTKTAKVSGDFGYGWSLGIQDANIRETVGKDYPFVADKTKVYISTPDGSRVGFTYKETFISGFPGFGAVFAPYFTPDPGNYYQLSLPDDQYVGHGGAIGALGDGINPTHYRLTTPDGMMYDYDQFKGLQKITDKNGNTVTYTPDAITHSGGRVIKLNRDAQGRITSVTLPDGAVGVRYRYDANGDLIEVKQVTDATPVEKTLTSSISYLATPKHYLSEYIDPNGNKAVEANYDAAGRLIGITDAMSNTPKQSFNLENFVETLTDARGNSTFITYDDRGNVTKTVQPTEFGDIVTATKYEDPNNPDKETTSIDGKGYVTTRAFDASGSLLSETTPDGTTVYQYNGSNKLAQVKDTLGRVTAYGYDSTGVNLTRVVTPNGDASNFTYDDQGHVSSYADFKNNVTLFTDYCACGRPLTVINPDGSFRKSKTNQYSQITKTTDEELHFTSSDYDNQGRLISQNDGMGNITRYEYTGANQTKVIDPLGNVTRYEYDADNRRTKIIDANGGVTSFGYDANGNLASVTDPVGNTTSYQYDAANRQKSMTDPNGNVTRYEYDAVGNQTKITDPDNRVRVFEYDGMKRQTAEKWLDATGAVIRTITSVYDAAGNLLQTADPDAVLSYTYDNLNRMITATTNYPGSGIAPVTLAYSYDKNGNLAGTSDNTGVSVAQGYDNRNRLETQIWSGGGIDAASVKYAYYKNNQLDTVTRYADAGLSAKVGSSKYTYQENGLVQTITHKDGSGNTLAGYSYLYDNAGKLTQESHHGKTYVYGYDPTGQLTSVKINGSLSESFQYDANGNRQASTGPNGNQTYQTGKGNQLKSDGLFSYSYDKEGNLKTKTEIASGKVTTYTWDYRNRLTKVEERNTSGLLLYVSEYAYDPTGRRILQKTNIQSLYTIYNRDDAWVDVGGNGVVSARYLFGSGYIVNIARWQPGKGTAWYLTDHLGTVRDLAGSTGSAINHIDYLAFGQIFGQTNTTMGDRYTFTGREWDADTWDYYYRARYYDPTAGRFTSVDPIGYSAGDHNLFRYVSNAPMSFTDPTGTVALTETSALNQNALTTIRAQLLRKAIQACFISLVFEIVNAEIYNVITGRHEVELIPNFRALASCALSVGFYAGTYYPRILGLLLSHPDLQDRIRALIRLAEQLDLV